MTDQLPIHQQYICHCENTDTVIVFIHGILGSPLQFDFIIPVAQAYGYSIVNLLLPGHGGNGKAFAKNNARAWEHYLNNHLTAMRDRYTRIILVSHSLGCLLAIQSYLNNPDKIIGIFCLGIPLSIRAFPGGIGTSLKVAFGCIKDSDDVAMAAKRVYGVSNQSLWVYPMWVPRFIDLFILAKAVKKQLYQVKVPMCILQSKKDEYVSLKSIKVLQTQLTHCEIAIKLLPNSCHFYYHKVDIETIKKCFDQFISTVS